MKRLSISVVILALACMAMAGVASAAGANDRTYDASLSTTLATPGVTLPYILTVTNHSQNLCQMCTPLHFIQQIQITVPVGFSLVTPSGSSSPVTSIPSNWKVQTITNLSPTYDPKKPQVITFVTISSTDASLIVGQSVSFTIYAKYTGPDPGCTTTTAPFWTMYVNQSVTGGVGNVYTLAQGNPPQVTVSSCLKGTTLGLTLTTSTGGQSVSTSQPNATATLTALLTTGNNVPVPNKPIDFIYGNGLACSGATDPTGTATCTFVPQQSPYSLGPGVYTFYAEFTTDATYGGSASSTRDLTVNDGTSVSLLDVLDAPYNGSITMTATLTANTVGALSGRYITFSINGTDKGTAKTDGSGVAILSNVDISGINAGPHDGWLKATFGGEVAYNGTYGLANLKVLQQGLTINWDNPADIHYGTALSGTQLNATVTPSVTVTPAYNPAAGTVLNAGNGQILQVTFTPADLTNYPVVSKSVTINVLKADQTIAFGTLGNKTYGDPDFDVSASATATSHLLVYFTSGTPGVCTSNGATGATIHIVAAGPCTIVASQPGTDNFNAAGSVSQTFTVNPANQAALAVVATPLTYNQSETLTTTGGSSGGAVTMPSYRGPARSPAPNSRRPAAPAPV
jgi:hypothetical protein